MFYLKLQFALINSPAFVLYCRGSVKVKKRHICPTIPRPAQVGGGMFTNDWCIIVLQIDENMSRWLEGARLLHGVQHTKDF